jgi:hypothetical protein
MCDLETSWMRRPWPTGGCRAKNKTKTRSQCRFQTAYLHSDSWKAYNPLKFVSNSKFQARKYACYCSWRELRFSRRILHILGFVIIQSGISIQYMQIINGFPPAEAHIRRLMTFLVERWHWKGFFSQALRVTLSFSHCTYIPHIFT